MCNNICVVRVCLELTFKNTFRTGRWFERWDIPLKFFDHPRPNISSTFFISNMLFRLFNLSIFITMFGFFPSSIKDSFLLTPYKLKTLFDYFHLVYFSMNVGFYSLKGLSPLQWEHRERDLHFIINLYFCNHEVLLRWVNLVMKLGIFFFPPLVLISLHPP